MRQSDVKDILNMIASLYKGAFSNLTEEQKRQTILEWEAGLSEELYANVRKAINSHHSKHPGTIPSLQDIFFELMNIDEQKYQAMFDTLCRHADMSVNPQEHMTTLDKGGFRWSDEHQRKIYCHAETIKSTKYRDQDFTSMPDEVQRFAGDIKGLTRLYYSIETNGDQVYKNFKAAVPGIRVELTNERVERWSKPRG